MPLPILQLHPPRRLVREPAPANTALIARHPRGGPFALGHVPGALVPSAAEEPKHQARDGDEEDAEADGDAGFFADVVVAVAAFGAVEGGFGVEDEGQGGAGPDGGVGGVRGHEEGEVGVVFEVEVLEVVGFDLEVGDLAVFVADAVLFPDDGVVGDAFGVGARDGRETDGVGAVEFEEGGIPGYWAGVKFEPVVGQSGTGNRDSRGYVCPTMSF